MLLQNFLVIELANVLAGPSVGMFLAEQGAEVIKIENIKTKGDVTRGWKLKEEVAEEDISAYFACANWGKKSIAIDITKPEGKEIIYKLIEKADIVISSYKAGDDVKLGMDYETLKKKNPKLIYASISGYGKEDERVAYDAVLQAETGFMSINGTAESGPLKMPVALMDILAAHQLKEAILLALIKRLKTGEGSFVHVSLFQSAIAALANQATNYLFTGQIPQATGSLHPNIAPYGETFTTKDGKKIILAVGSDKQFHELCKILKITETENLTSNRQRVQNRTLLQKLLEEKICRQNSEDLLIAFNKKNIPSGWVQNVAEALSAKESEPIKLKSNSYFGLRQAAFQFFENDRDKESLLRPPHFSEHSAEIMRKYLNFTEKEIKTLKADNVID